jgi:hypothetical protein
MYCPKCGWQLNPEARFCPRCGSAVQQSARDPLDETGEERDRRYQRGALLIVGVPLAVLAIVAFAKLASPVADKGSAMTTVAEKPAEPAVAPSAPFAPDEPRSDRTPIATSEPAPETKKDPPSPHTLELTNERKTLVSYLGFLAAFMKASAFTDRAQIYCRFTISRAMGVADIDPDELYSELLRAKPATQEEEQERQYGLLALRQRISAYDTNLKQCQGLVVSGFQKLPSDQDLSDKGSQAKERIAAIDQELSASK